MNISRYEAMDAQRFNPMRRTTTRPFLPIKTTEKDMGQLFGRASRPELPPNEAVGGIWNDHELVFVPIQVSPTGASETSSSDPESDTSATSSSHESSSYFTTPSDASVIGSSNTSPPSASRQVDVFDRDDLIVTRTIIRPTPRSPVTGLFSGPSGPIASRPNSPFSRPTSPIMRALNCFNPSAFERDVDSVQAERVEPLSRQPVLQVIVTQTREQYEQDMAFKEAVQEIYPEASGRRRATS
ncbi:hypothetical protein F5I97DRAFT_225769 [Phlebopus sp. FC_14]|nr:hypothetical protein F5I97DRAFT_225769 [Phlebopus sp. FC_14]